MNLANLDVDHEWPDAIVVATWPDGSRMIRVLDMGVIHWIFKQLDWYGGMPIAVWTPWATDSGNMASGVLGTRHPTVMFALDRGDGVFASFATVRSDRANQWALDSLPSSEDPPDDLMNRRMRSFLFDQVFDTDVLHNSAEWYSLNVTQDEVAYRLGVPRVLSGEAWARWSDSDRLEQLDRMVPDYEKRALEGHEEGEPFPERVTQWLKSVFPEIDHSPSEPGHGAIAVVVGAHVWDSTLEPFRFQIKFFPSFLVDSSSAEWQMTEPSYGITLHTAETLSELVDKAFFFVADSNLPAWRAQYLSDPGEIAFDDELFRLVSEKSPIFWDIPDFVEFAEEAGLEALHSTGDGTTKRWADGG